MTNSTYTRLEYIYCQDSSFQWQVAGDFGPADRALPIS